MRRSRPTPRPSSSTPTWRRRTSPRLTVTRHGAGTSPRSRRCCRSGACPVPTPARSPPSSAPTPGAAFGASGGGSATTRGPGTPTPCARPRRAPARAAGSGPSSGCVAAWRSARRASSGRRGPGLRAAARRGAGAAARAERPAATRAPGRRPAAHRRALTATRGGLRPRLDELEVADQLEHVAGRLALAAQVLDPQGSTQAGICTVSGRDGYLDCSPKTTWLHVEPVEPALAQHDDGQVRTGPGRWLSTTPFAAVPWHPTQCLT